MNNDLVILSKGELLAIRNSLQFCNDSPNGGISDTLWMMDSPETIFDAFDELLNKGQVVDGEALYQIYYHVTGWQFIDRVFYEQETRREKRILYMLEAAKKEGV